MDARKSRGPILRRIFFIFAAIMIAFCGHASAQTTDLVALATEHMRQAHEYELQNQSQAAIAEYDEAARLLSQRDVPAKRPTMWPEPYEIWLPDVLIRRGLNYMSLKDYEKAVADYSEVIRLHPDHDAAYMRRGEAYGLMGDNVRKKADEQKVLQLWGLVPPQ